MRFCFLLCLLFSFFVFLFKLRAKVGNSRHSATRLFPQSSLAKWSLGAPRKRSTRVRFPSGINISNDGKIQEVFSHRRNMEVMPFLCSLFLFARSLVTAFIPLPVHFRSLLWPSGTLEGLASTSPELDSREFQKFRTAEKLKSSSIIDATWK